MKLTSFSTWLLVLIAALFSVAFNSHDDDFMFYLYSNRIYSPGDNDILVYLNARSREKVTLTMRAYRIADPIGFFLSQPNPHSPGEPDTSDNNISRIDVRNTRRFTKVAEWEHQLKRQRDYWNNDQIAIPLKEKGVYVVQATAKGKEAATVIIITEFGMIVKQSKSEALAFVLNRKTGEKVPSVPVAFARGKDNAVRATGDADGVARTSLAGMGERKRNGDAEEWDPWGGGNQLLVIAEKDGNFAISDSYYYRYYGGGQGSYQMYLHTDRPVYRPSQIVYYRGITRKIEADGSYNNVTDKKVEIEITDTRGASIGKDTLTLSDFGTFNGSVTLGEEPPLGDYTIKATVDGEPHTFTFAVEEYKKPEYEVVVTTDKQQYTRGDEINATVKADYYFGSPVAEGDVQYFVYRSRFYRPWWYGSRWSYLYEFDGGDRYAYYGGMEMVHSGNGKLKSDGTFSFSYKTDTKSDEDYIYRVQANVVDASRRSIAGMTSVKVTRGAFYLTAQTDRYLYKPGEKAIVTVSARSFDGDQPVATSFDVKVGRSWWDSRRSHDETVWNGSGQTGSDGVGTVQFTPTDNGYYNIEVTAKDDRGNRITTSQSMYVAEQNWAYWDQGGGVRIIPDRELYKPGETMSALIIMPEAGMDALVTLEGAAIYKHQVQRISSTSAIVRFPIEERHVPNIYISVAALRGDQFHSSQSRVSVAPEKKVIRIEIEPSKTVYKPGEAGTVTVRALDNTGEPVANVDVALAMVDEAIYAIRPDATQAIEQAFYGARGNEVNTSTSLYFHFYNQAVQAAAPMAAGFSAESGDALMSRADDAAGNMRKMAAPPAPPPAPDFVQPVVRTDFRDLMFWTPSVRTGTDGTARVEVKFPDNLTTWRMTARGVTRATQVGQATAEVIARKDLLVRMETPRFITQGDELLIATTVHNYLSTAKQTKVQFSATGVELKNREQTVTIPANGEQRIDWKIVAPKTGEAKLTVKALTDEESDAMELKVPILPRGVKSATSVTANLEGKSETKNLSLSIPSNADPSTGEMYVNLSPSAASSILGALDDLIGYPYGCVEQTMSRFLPTVVVADALGKIDVPFDAAKRDELPKMVTKGLMRLYNFQHSDGGWGWWEHDATNPFMTAYVMYGMTVAKRAGYDVDEERYQRGIQSLLNQIESRPSGGGLGNDEKRLNNTTEAYMLYVAGFIGSDGAKNALVTKRIAALAKSSDLNNYGKALLALAAHHYGDQGTASTLASALEKAATTSGTGTHWKGTAWHYNWQDDEVETSAYVIKALLAIRGETDLVEHGIQWLLTQKTGDSWHNTRQTAMVVYTIVDYVQNSKELNPEYTVAVNVNGREVFRQGFTRRDVFGAEKQVKIPATGLNGGANSITITKSGEGRLYVAARLVYFATGPAIQPASAGFKVEREYYLLRRVKSKGQYIYEKKPFKGEVQSGDELLVKVKIRPDSRYEYFMLEDPLPAGCEVITETSGYNIPGESGYGEQNSGGYYRDSFRPWNWWYADRDVRDEKVAFFAQQIEAQDYQFSYIMRAQIPGSYSVMPSVGALMYYPEVRGNSGAIAMRITE